MPSEARTRLIRVFDTVHLDAGVPVILADDPGCPVEWLGVWTTPRFALVARDTSNVADPAFLVVVCELYHYLSCHECVGSVVFREPGADGPDVAIRLLGRLEDFEDDHEIAVFF